MPPQVDLLQNLVQLSLDPTTKTTHDDSQEVAELNRCKLESVVSPDYTTHVFYQDNPEQGIWRQKVETKWNRVSLLGEGSFGEVWLEEKVNGSSVRTERAVKLINKARMRRYNVNYRREIAALARFSKAQYFETELFVKFFGWFEDEKKIFLAMEYLPLGDLSQCVDRPISEKETKQITVDLLKGLAHIHEEGYVHRDLKPQNVFVYQRPPHASKWRVKIGDFGISKRTQNDDTAFRTFLGTQGYMAPEIFKVSGYIDSSTAEPLKYDSAVDVWSLGCVMYKLITGQIPFPIQNHSRELSLFCSGRSPFPAGPLSGKLSPDGIGLLTQLLHASPIQRLTAKEALDEAWIISEAQSSDPQLSKPSPTENLAMAPGVMSSEADDDVSSTVVQTPDETSSVTTLISSISHLPWQTALETQADYSRKFTDGAIAKRKREEALRLFHHAGYLKINGPYFTTEDALVSAAQQGHEEIVRLLLEAGVKPDRQCGMTAGHTILNSTIIPLVAAAQRGHDNIVRLLLDYGANLELKGTSCTKARPYTSHTALHAAIENDHEATARILIEAGANVEAKDYFDNSPLHSAAEIGQCAILNLLLDNGARLEATSDILYGGGTPLHTAVRRRQPEAVRLLLERGANLNAKDKNNHTPQDCTRVHSLSTEPEIAVIRLILLDETERLQNKESGV